MPESLRHFIAEVRPCEMPETECSAFWSCANCRKDGTRAVVTDIEIEPAVVGEGVAIERAPSNMRTTIWREAPDA